MWLQLRLYLLVGLMFAILYGIIVGIGYLLGYSGSTFYVFIIGFALVLILLQYMIAPKIVEWSMRIRYVNEKEYPKLHQMVGELADKLKENPAWQDIPMMFLTIWKDKFEGNNSDFPCNDYIEKPLDMRDLKQRIDTVLKDQ